MRLDKWLSDATNYTRSQLKQLIRSGQVTVNDCIVKRPETAVCQTDTICLQGKPVTADTFCYCLLLHKPLGYVCAVTDATEKTVMELIPPDLQRKGLFPVGRLDKDTTGLLLLTNDGAFSHALLAPRRHIPKYYWMQLARPYEVQYAEQLAAGLTLADGTHCLPAEILPIPNTEREAVICLQEGKYHQVRRMMAAVGNHVEQLQRIAMGGLCLPSDLLPGDCVPLTAVQMELLQQPNDPDRLRLLAEKIQEMVKN